MGKRIVPSYIAKPAWAVVEERDRFMDDMGGTVIDIVKAINRLERALLRDPSTLLDAPDYITTRELK
jgi:hypothetical protein